MPRTRVLHLTFDMRIGGAERVIKTLVEETPNSNFTASVLCLEDNIGPFGQALIALGYRVDKLGRRPGFDFALLLQIRRYLIDQQIDIVHCHQYTPWVYGAFASFLTTTKVIFTEHGRFYPDRKNWKRRVVNPALVLFTDSITAICQATRDALGLYEFIPVEKIRIIYNGIRPISVSDTGTTPLRDEIGIPQSAVIVGTLARLDAVKNHTMMLNAFRQTLNAGFDSYLIIVGDGPERQKLMTLARMLEIEERVLFTGFIESPEKYLRLMTVYLLTSLSEGAAMTLLEAMSMGKPCVVTDAGGNAELVQDGSTGFVVEVNDEDRFAAAIGTLLSDPGLEEKFAKNAEERFNQNFTAQIMCDKYCDLYDELCPRNNRKKH